MSITPSLHPTPLSVRILKSSSYALINSRQRQHEIPNLFNKIVVVLSKTGHTLVSALDVLVAAVETVAAGLIGSISFAAIKLCGIESPSLRDFCIKTCCYSFHSAATISIIFLSVFDEPHSRIDESTFAHHFIAGSIRELIEDVMHNLVDRHLGTSPASKAEASRRLYDLWVKDFSAELQFAVDHDRFKNTEQERIMTYGIFIALLNSPSITSKALNRSSLDMTMDLWKKACILCPRREDIHSSIPWDPASLKKFVKDCVVINKLSEEEFLRMMVDGPDSFIRIDEAASLPRATSIRARIIDLLGDSARYILERIDSLRIGEDIYRILDSQTISDSNLTTLLSMIRTGVFSRDINPDRFRQALERLSMVRVPAPVPIVSRVPAPVAAAAPASAGESELIAPAEVLEQVADLRNIHNYRQMISALSRHALSTAFRCMPQFFCDPNDVNPETGAPVTTYRPLETRVSEGKTNLQGLMPIGLIGVAKLAQYFEVMYGNTSCVLEHPSRYASIRIARATLQSFSSMEKRLLISMLIAGDTIMPEINRLPPARKAIIIELASRITELSSHLTEAVRTGSVLERDFANNLKDEFMDAYRTHAPTLA